MNKIIFTKKLIHFSLVGPQKEMNRTQEQMNEMSKRFFDRASEGEETATTSFWKIELKQNYFAEESIQW